MAAFEQWFSGGIQVKRDGVLIEKGVDLDVGALRIDAGSLVPSGDKSIADCILDAEGQKVQAGEGTATGAHLHLDCLLRCEPLGPGECRGGVIDILFRFVGTLADFPQNTAGDVRLEIDPVHGRPGCAKADTAFGFGRRRHAEALKLCFKHAFQSTWAGCKEPSFCTIHPYPFLYENPP